MAKYPFIWPAGRKPPHPVAAIYWTSVELDLIVTIIQYGSVHICNYPEIKKNSKVSSFWQLREVQHLDCHCQQINTKIAKV